MRGPQSPGPSQVLSVSTCLARNLPPVTQAGRATDSRHHLSTRPGEAGKYDGISRAVFTQSAPLGLVGPDHETQTLCIVIDRQELNIF